MNISMSINMNMSTATDIAHVTPIPTMATRRR